MAFNFGEPLVLLFLLVVPPIIYFYKIHTRKRKKAALKFSSIGILKEVSPKSTIRAHLPFTLILVVL